MKKYPKYKPSNIDWIGDIPEHWKAIPMRYLLKQKITDGPHETPVFISDGIPFLSVDGIKNGELNFENCRNISVEDFNRYKQKCVVEKDDILMGKAASVGKVARVKVDFDFTIWSPLALLKPNKLIIDPRYFEYFLKSTYAQDNANILSTYNTQQNISMADIPRIYYTLPNTLDEQILIANYLDKKIQEIEQLIEDKKQLLKLIKEEKITLINQIITKGLSENQKFKDSKVEFIGEIPDSWSIKKIKHIVSKVGSGVTPSGGAEVYELFGIPLLRSQNIHFDGLRLDDVAFINEDIHNKMKNSKVFSGDVLLNITGASIGRCFYVDENLGEANVNQHVSILRPNEKVLTKYLYYILYSNIGQEQIRKEQTGSGREGLNFEVLKNFQIPIPEISEQKAILDYIESQRSQIDFKIYKTKKLIDLLIEYRSALISEVVTGKVKVID